MENEAKLPSWMNEDFFATVIKHHSGDKNAKLTDFKTKPTLDAGDHVVSTMFRVGIKYSTTSVHEKVLSVVIKIPPVGNTEADLVVTSPLYENEQEMYAGPLDEIKSVLESVGEFCNINPKLIYQSKMPHCVIVLEDVGELGFTKIRQALGDFEDSKVVFQRLAKFHAASFFLINERKADFSRFKFSMFQLEDSFRHLFLVEPVEVFMEVLESWGGHDEIIEKLKVFKEKIIERGQKLYQPDPEGYNVLNHSDFHIKNLLFKKNDAGRIEDIFMMDFQASILASPCVDLFYALYNAISDEDRRTRRDEIIHYYHTEFSDMLRRLGFIGKIPSLLDLQTNLLKQGWMEVLKCLAFKIFFWTDVADANINEVFTSKDSRGIKARIFNDEKFKNFIKAELPWLVSRGFL